MAQKKQRSVSAQVVLKPASGKSVGQTAITSENIKDFLPSQEAVRAARKAFMEAGFEVGNVVANSFSITGPADTFEKVFETRLRRDSKTGAVKAARTGGSATFELPLNGLPGEAARVVEAVTFTPPPDFGPGNY